MSCGVDRIADGMKRGCIFFFYDGQGIVDDYVTYFLDDLLQNVDEAVFVSNGPLSEQGRAAFEKYNGKIIERANEGLDVGAYKDGIHYFGYEHIKEFDELILLNHTMMGPVYPFSITFESMKNRELDFWGLTKHFETEDPFGFNPYKKFPEHIQSHFLVFRKSLLESEDFERYWEDMKPIKSYQESVCYHESYCTQHFKDLGYSCDVSTYCDDLKDISDYPLLYCSREMVENRKCPVFKRRALFNDYWQYLETTSGEDLLELYKFLDESGLYNTDMIWQNACRTMDHVEVSKNLHLNYTLPSTVSYDPEIEKKLEGKKVAYFMHIYYVEELLKFGRYLNSLPEYVDIFISTQNEEKKERIEEFLKSFPNKSKVFLVNNRGRDVSALLIGGKEFIFDYDYVCFAHDKKVTQEKPGTVGISFAYGCYRNILESRDYVNNILYMFEKDKHLGVLCPPKPLHGPYVIGLGKDWSMNYENTKALLQRLGIKAVVKEHKPPIAPHGSCFWFRTDAIRPLLEYDWKYEDFPEEPLPIDGTISHAIERSYAYVAFSRCYYAAKVMSDEYSRIEFSMLNHYSNSYYDLALRNGLSGRANRGLQVGEGLQYKIKYGLRKMVPKKLFVGIINLKRKIFGPYIEYKYEDN